MRGVCVCVCVCAYIHILCRERVLLDSEQGKTPFSLDKVFRIVVEPPPTTAGGYNRENWCDFKEQILGRLRAKRLLDKPYYRITVVIQQL